MIDRMETSVIGVIVRLRRRLSMRTWDVYYLPVVVMVGVMMCYAMVALFGRCRVENGRDCGGKRN